MDKLDKFLKSSLDTRERLKEADAAVARLKEELSMTRTVEDNLRCQLTRAQDRAITMQREINKMKDLFAQSEKLEQTNKDQARKVELLISETKELQAVITQKVASASEEKKLSMIIGELKKRVEERDNLLNLVRIENQVLCNKKDAEIEQLKKHLEDITKHRLVSEKKNIQLNEMSVQLLGGTVETSPARKRRMHVTWSDAERQSIQDNEISSQGVNNELPNIEERRPIFTLNTPRKIQSPLEIMAVKDSTNQRNVKRKRLYSNNSNHFL